MRTEVEQIRDCIAKLQNLGHKISHVVFSTKTLMKFENGTLCFKNSTATVPPSFMGHPALESKILPDHVQAVVILEDGNIVQVVDDVWFNQMKAAEAMAEKQNLNPVIH